MTSNTAEHLAQLRYRASQYNYCLSTRSNASSYIVFFKQVERAFGRMKFYRILATTWYLNLVKCANSILLITGALVNLQPSLVKKV